MNRGGQYDDVPTLAYIGFDYSISQCCSNRGQRRLAPLRGYQILKWILYADDMVVFARTTEEAKNILQLVSDTCKRFGLTVSFGKTKTQVFHDEELADKPFLFSVDGHEIENVREFTYLGHVISNSNQVNFTEHRIARASAKFNELRTVLCDTDINLKSRRKILEACVRSRLLYGVSAWAPKEREIKQLETCWFRLLRTMVKGGWKRHESADESEVDYRFVYTNSDLAGIIQTAPFMKKS